MENVTKALSLALLSVLSIVFSNTATATPCDVGGIFSDANLTMSVASCLDGVDSNDSATDLNDGNYFGIDTWVLLAKDGDESYDSGINLTGGMFEGALSGDFSFDASVWDSYSDVIIVLKDGVADPTNPIKWSAYLLDDFVSSGYWEYDGVKELSHISVYASPVPVPAAVWLFASGLIGLVGVARKRA